MASALERYREWQREGVSGKVSQADTASKLQDSARAAGRSALERYRLWETTRPYDQSDFQSYLDRRSEITVYYVQGDWCLASYQGVLGYVFSKYVNFG